MTNEGADQPVRCQKNEESLIPVYRPVRSGLTGSTGSIYDLHSRGKDSFAGIRMARNGCEWLGMDWEWLRMVRNGLRMARMVRNGLRMARMAENGCECIRMVGNGWQCLENGSEWIENRSECRKWFGMDGNGWEWLRNGWKCREWLGMPESFFPPCLHYTYDLFVELTCSKSIDNS